MIFLFERENLLEREEENKQDLVRKVICTPKVSNFWGAYHIRAGNFFILQSFFDGCKQIVVGFKRRVLRIVALDGLGRTEQESCL